MIGEIIRKARISKKMTTRELAEEAEVTQSMVSRYESGKVIPTKEVLIRLSKALGISLKSVTENLDLGESFDQRDFDLKLARAKSLGIAEKKALLVMVNSFLKNRDAEILVSNWKEKS